MFIFLTRSYDEGFRVCVDSGARADEATARDFDEALTFSGVKDSAEACAVMFRRKGKIYVLARSMDTGRKDKNTRNILFTFCVVLARNEGDTARRIFSHLAGRWDECEGFMRSCLGKNFEHERFIAFLKDYPADVKLPPKNAIVRCAKGGVPAVRTVRPSGFWRHVRYGAVYLAVIACVVYVTSGLHSSMNVPRIAEEAKSYTDSAGAKLRSSEEEQEVLSADVHARLKAIHDEERALLEAKSAITGLYEEAQTAHENIELSYLRIRSMQNADSREAEHLAKSSGEAADKAGEFSSSLPEKVKALREKLGL